MCLLFFGGGVLDDPELKIPESTLKPICSGFMKNRFSLSAQALQGVHPQDQWL